MMSSSDTAVLTLCEEVWKWRLSESPEVASYYGFHQHDDRWDDISEQAYVRREAHVREFLAKAESLNIESCSQEVALSYTLLVDDLKLYLDGAPFRTYLMGLNYMEGIHLISSLIISYMKFDTEEDFDKYITRLERLPQRIEQTISVLKRGVEEKLVQSSCSVAAIPAQIDGILNTPVDDVGLLKPFKEEHPQIQADKLKEYQTKARDLVVSGIFPALRTLKKYVEEDYFTHLRPEAGIGSVKDGGRWYQQALNFFLTCDETPQHVHELGLKEVKRIREQILKVAEKEGLGQTLPAIKTAISAKLENYFQSKEEVINYVKDICYNKIRPKLSQLFKNLPNKSMKIEMAPEYIKDSAAAIYLSGTPDGSREGCYYISAHNFKACLPNQLLALSLHEGEPGHHLQGVYALAATHLPDFRRHNGGTKYYLAPARFSLNTAYAEGWGLYSEALGEELDLYQDNMDLLGRYTFEIFRAARLVVDTGIHAFGWTKEQAVEYMLENTLTREMSLRTEVDRYVSMPGQACAYKYGEIRIWELRRKAEKELGGCFDIKEFHHRVLSCGAIPLRVMENIVDQYIQEVKATG